MRAINLQKLFPPAYFIIFVRNPYAHCQSLMSRNDYTAKEAAYFAIKCLIHQKSNLELLDMSLFISYEEFTESPVAVQTKLQGFLPSLNDLKLDRKFNAHNFKGIPLEITNLNTEKINKLTNEELIEIDSVFSDHKELLSYFGYSLINVK